MLYLADVAQAHADTVGTHNQRASDWAKWEEFLIRFGIGSDRQLDAFSSF